MLLLIYAFTGFEMAAIPAGETENPRRNLPRALLIAIGVVAVVYVLIQVVCIGTLPGLGNSAKPLADAGQQFMGNAGGALISAGAIISIAGNLNIVLLSGSRVPFAIAEQNQLPAFLARVHRRFFTPHVAIVITAALMLVLTLKSSFVQALTISTIARLVTYAATCLALPVLRHRKDAPPMEFRVRGGTADRHCLTVAGGVASDQQRMTDWTAGKKWWAFETVQAALAGAVGLALYFGYRLYRGRAS